MRWAIASVGGKFSSVQFSAFGTASRTNPDVEIVGLHGALPYYIYICRLFEATPPLPGMGWAPKETGGPPINGPTD